MFTAVGDTFARETLLHSILSVTEVRGYIYIGSLRGNNKNDLMMHVRHLSLEPWSTAGILFVMALQMNVGMCRTPLATAPHASIKN